MEEVNIINNVFKIFTNDYVRTFTSIIALLLSVINFIWLLVTSAKRIHIEIKYAYFRKNYLTSLFLGISFVVENRSRIPLAVSRAFVILKNKKDRHDILSYEFSNRTIKISHMKYSTNDTVTETYPQLSSSLPQSLQGLGASGGIFYTRMPIEFDELFLIENYNFFLEIYTTRGKKQIKLDMKSLLENKDR